jgi:hypothetical protein
MSLAEIMVVAVPSALVIFKLTALTFAAVYLVGGGFGRRDLLLVDRRRIPWSSIRARAKQV